jgi:alpha/beta superfamily hydrolase
MASAFILTESEKTSDKTSLRAVDLRGPAGPLEALLNEGAPDSPIAALVCHPHPLGGGTMHNKVVYHAAKVMNSPQWGFRWPVLRFNFRGTGLSEGSHDGRAESADVAAALAWLKAEYRLPIVLAGFSFGAVMALEACCATSQSNVIALAALGLPTQGFGHHFRYPFLAECKLPKLFLSGDRDQFAPTEELRSAIHAAADPKKFILIPGADHSFSGRIEPMQQALASWLKEQIQ